jgi:hypothetical protein
MISKIKSDSIQSAMPCIGIFWLHYSSSIKIFYATPVTINSGREYGDFINTPDSHYDVWESLKSRRLVGSNIGYTYLPRGRVVYNKTALKYIVYTGAWISSSSLSIKAAIESEFKLPKTDTIYSTDFHYEKFSRWALP